MWFFVLIFNIIAFFVIYKVLDNRIKNASPLDELIHRHKKEVESTMILFNKTAFENISALESKLIETKELVKLLEKKLQEVRSVSTADVKERRTSVLESSPKDDEFKEIPYKSSKLDVTVSDAPNVVSFSVAAKANAKKSKNKKERVLELFNEGETIAAIASQLDISPDEVKYYVKRFVRV